MADNAPAKTRAAHRMPAFPAFEADQSYEEYMAADRGGAHRAERDQERFVKAVEHADACDPAAAEQAVEDAIVTSVMSQPLLREILYKTLAYCVEPRDFADVEAFIAATDEYAHGHVLQTPCAIARILVDVGGLERADFDAEGRLVDDARRAGLTADEVDDLVESTTLATTEAGAHVVDLLAPSRRIAAQLAQKPHRRDTYLAVLRFCSEPRSLEQIKEMLQTTPDMALDYVTAHQRLAPDYYIDRLEKTGALVWRGAWVTTEAGLRALASA